MLKPLSTQSKIQNVIIYGMYYCLVIFHVKKKVIFIGYIIVTLHDIHIMLYDGICNK